MASASPETPSARVSPPQARVVIMLHTHMPYYRRAGMWPFGEETIYQAMAEVYVPLLALLDEVAASQWPVALTLSLTPILAEQLNDADLQQGFVSYCHDRMARLQADIKRFEALQQPEPLALAKRYHHQYEQVVHRFVGLYKSNLIAALRAHAEAGRLELVASAATHALLPLMRQEPWLRLQLRLGVATFKRLFGQAPKGFWLPECGYRPAKAVGAHWLPGLETLLQDEGLAYFFTEYHAVEAASSHSQAQQLAASQATALPKAAVLPLVGTHQAYHVAESNVAVLARNNVASFQVWSASYGYPGDGAYREFHKSDDLSGAKYWRLTDKTLDLDHKQWYQPEQALAKVAAHAEHFVALLHSEAQAATAATGNPSPLINVAFDTELFGHWWYEGNAWLKAVLSRLAQTPELHAVTASQALTLEASTPSVTLPECTWGEGGLFWVWQNQHTEWIHTALDDVSAKLYQLLAQQHTAVEASPLLQRLALQAVRELLVMQASDWPFLITTRQAKDYAVNRLEGHRANLWQLVGMLSTLDVNETALEQLESATNPFSWLTWPMLHGLLGLPQAQRV
jgi:1,4-alpha-glucan branching enzyme